MRPKGKSEDGADIQPTGDKGRKAKTAGIICMFFPLLHSYFWPFCVAQWFSQVHIPDDVFLMLIIKDQEGVSVITSDMNKAGKLNSASQCQKGKCTHSLFWKVITAVFLSYCLYSHSQNEKSLRYHPNR